MSRVGRTLIPIPTNVKFNFADQEVTVKGPKGELRQRLAPGFEFEQQEGGLRLRRPSDEKRDRALHGLYRALVANMVKGVSEGYEITLELVGVGYRAEAKGQVLELALGFSHQIFFVLPPEIKVTTETAKGQNPRITLQGIDKQLLGQVAAKIRSLRPPEPYKGKGVRYANEVVRRKAGKASGKGKK